MGGIRTRKHILGRLWERSRIGKKKGCWLWDGNRTGNKTHKYGEIWVEVLRKCVKTHRLSWILHNGRIPRGMLVLHKCDVPHCWNPSHLFLGTQLDNMRDKVSKGRAIVAYGERHHLAKLTPKQVAYIRASYAAGKGTYGSFARRFGVTRFAIRNIVKFRAWKSIA